MPTIKKQIKAKKTRPQTNCNASIGTRKQAKVVKQEQPLDHANKQNKPKQEPRMVGVSLGMTKNMDNYESLRIDVWCTDVVHDGESFDQAFERVSDLCKARIDYEIEEILGDE